MPLQNHWLIFNNVGNRLRNWTFFNEEQKRFGSKGTKLDYEFIRSLKFTSQFNGLGNVILGKISISRTQNIWLAADPHCKVGAALSTTANTNLAMKLQQHFN
jgi:hypothetical protein